MPPKRSGRILGDVIGRYEQPGDDRSVDESYHRAPTPCFEKNEGSDVLGVVGGFDQPECLAEDAISMGIEEGCKGFRVACARSLPSRGFVLQWIPHTSYCPEASKRFPHYDSEATYSGLRDGAYWRLYNSQFEQAATDLDAEEALHEGPQDADVPNDAAPDDNALEADAATV